MARRKQTDEQNDRILEPTEPEAESVSEEVRELEGTKVLGNAIEPKIIPKKYATEYFRANKIPYCETCGAQYQNRRNGTPVCPEKRSNCPRLTQR